MNDCSQTTLAKVKLEDMKKCSTFVTWHIALEEVLSRDFPGGAVVKNPPASAGDMGSSPGPGTSHMLRSS